MVDKTQVEFERAIKVINKSVTEGEEIGRFLSRLVIDHYIRKTLAKGIIDDFVNVGRWLVKDNKIYLVK